MHDQNEPAGRDTEKTDEPFFEKIIETEQLKAQRLAQLANLTKNAENKERRQYRYSFGDVGR